MKTKFMKLKIKGMKMRNIISGGILACMLTLSSCSDFFEVNPRSSMNESDNYASSGEVYANCMGLAAVFQDAAVPYLLMAELKGDLMEPTGSAPSEYWEIYKYTATDGNKAISPAPLYKIVLACNDFLRHIVEFEEKFPQALPRNTYRGMISTAISYRAWAYLNIGKFFGEAVYYDLALVDVPDLGEDKLLQFDELIEELIYSMKHGVAGVDGFNRLNWVDITGGNWTWNRYGIQAHALMSELYLWNRSYADCVKEGMFTINKGMSEEITIDQHKLSNLLNSDWKTFFSGALGDNSAPYEVFTAVSFDQIKNQPNKLSDYMNSLWFKAHDSLMVKYLRDSILHEDGHKVAIDKNRGPNASYLDGGKINKYPTQNSFVTIYRASDVFLMVTEALCGLGDLAAADTLLNVGMITGTWDGKRMLPPFDSPIYAGYGGGDLQKCRGIRGRVGLEPKRLRDFVPADTLFAAKQFVLDSLIGEEVGLECAFEGKRWFTLMRMARNSNDPTKLAIPMSLKFADEGERNKCRKLLMKPENWFFKYDQLNVK